MSQFHNIRLAALICAILAGVAAQSHAQSRPPMRAHTEDSAAALKLVVANTSVRGNRVQITQNGARREMRTNGVPDHAVGAFPNRGNPHRIKAQNKVYRMAARPKVGAPKALQLGQLFGVAMNGVPFDPGAAEFWQGNPRSGWQYEALGGAVPLGLDGSYGHVQPSGAYHYHGLPVGLMQNLGWSGRVASPLIGYAADGVPIYAITANVGGKVVKMTSSYRLKSGQRPGGRAPGGAYDGAFVQDWQYVKGAGSLDACNGAKVVTAEYPQGTYAYFLTQTFPVIPRCLRGVADRSFSHRPGRG